MNLPARTNFGQIRSGRRCLRVGLALLMALGLVLSTFFPVFAQSTQPGPTDPAELAAFVDGVMAAGMSADHIPGAVVSVVKDGKLLFARGYGFADESSRIPVEPDTTLFRPGSVSKLFTWTAVMQLAEQDRLSLDADVNTYLDFKIPATFPEPITLKHLMTHSAGFEDKLQGLFKLDPAELVPLGQYLKQNLPARVYPPGKTGAYSNYGTALAGYIVERISGVPFPEYIEKNIFAPLKMNHATFRQPLPEALAKDMSGGYNYVGGEYLQGKFELINAAPAGALSAAAVDMAHFMIAHLQNGRYERAQILKESTARQMHSLLRQADPRLDGMAYGFFVNVINGQTIISHGGDTILFHSGLFLIPEQNVGLYISTNGASGSMLVQDLLQAFINRYYPAASSAALVPAPDFATRKGLYSGTYYLSRSNFTSFEKLISLIRSYPFRVEDHYVLFTSGGQITRFIETEPNLLVDIDHPENRLVMKVENGQVTLSPSGPFVFVKMPPEMQLWLSLLIFCGGGLMCLYLLIRLTIAFVRGLIHRQHRLPGMNLAGLAVWLFAAGYLFFMIQLAEALTSNDPIYGMPPLLFSMPTWFVLLLKLPLVLAALEAILIICAAISWWKRYWTLGERIGYSLIPVFTAVMLWSLHFWNLL